MNMKQKHYFLDYKCGGGPLNHNYSRILCVLTFHIHVLDRHVLLHLLDLEHEEENGARWHASTVNQRWTKQHSELQPQIDPNDMLAPS